MPPPNPRVQRTRSSPSALREPLTRHPLGGSKAIWCLMVVATFASCATGLDACKDIVGSKPVQQGPPAVPKEFWDSHKDGTVVLEFRIGNEGSVIDPRVVSSPGHEYSYYALETVKKWRYEPSRCDGRPIATDMTVTIRFSHE